jgi:hypothetical protein
MKKTKLILKTEKDYVKAHRKLWNEVIRLIPLHIGRAPDYYLALLHIKEEAYRNLWIVKDENQETEMELFSWCFACLWAPESDCLQCLFDFKYTQRKGCLNGLYGKLNEKLNKFNFNSSKKNIDIVINLCKQIRDFPIRKD